MRTIRPFLSLQTVLLSSLRAMAQIRRVTGRVVNAGSNASIPNVSINVEGFPVGATTDINLNRNLLQHPQYSLN